jgi:hypothetical protein
LHYSAAAIEILLPEFRPFYRWCCQPGRGFKVITNNELAIENIVKARCPRCLTAQNHVVIEVVDERTTRIRCNACEAISIYKGNKTSKSKGSGKGSASTRKSPTAQAANEREEWASLRPGMQPENAIPYRMTGVYHARDLVQHDSFGLGLVTREVRPHKIEVLFA